MLRASITRIVERRETIMVLASFVASSVFWIAVAFAMSANEYGELMTVQAAVMLVVAAMTWRTHDLVYHLVVSRGAPLDHAYRTALVVEGLAACVVTAACVAGALWWYADNRDAALIVAIFGFLAALSVVQQAAVAKLRQADRPDGIVIADGLTCAGWLAAFLAIPFLAHEPRLMLVIGAVPQALRMVTLFVFASRAHAHAVDAANQPQPDASTRVVARFLLSGQLVNVIKNGATSVETLVAAAFFGPALVAMHRLAKSSLGVATAAVNVAFQQAFAATSRASGPTEQARAVGQLRSRAIRIGLAGLPFSLGFAVVYGWYQAEVSIPTFLLVTLAVWIGFVPTVTQQAPFMLVSLFARHGDASVAFLLGFLCFMLVSTLLFIYPAYWLFAVAILIGGLVRHVWLERAAARIVRGQARHAATAHSDFR